MLVKNNIIYVISYISILIGFYFNEDVLGGSKNDYLYHLKFVQLFSNDLIYGLHVYGYDGYLARNSPIFYIILSFFDKFMSSEFLRYLHTLSAPILSILFYKALKLKFNFVKKDKLKIFSVILFLSPTIRSLAIWPYPLIWSLIFFILATYFYLLFEKKKNLRNIYYCFICIIISAYINYTFAVFVLFFLIKLLRNYKTKLSILNLSIFLSLCSVPAIAFLFFRNGIHVFGGADGLKLSLHETFNFSNKILIISSIIFFYLIPFLKLNDLFIIDKSKSILLKTLVGIVCILLILMFDYPHTLNFGGGVIFKFSNLFFENNLLFYMICFISFFLFLNLFNDFNSFLLIIILTILYNLQFTIYMKYYDPLILFLILFFFNKNFIIRFFKDKFYLQKIYLFSILVYSIFFVKSYIF